MMSQLSYFPKIEGRFPARNILASGFMPFLSWILRDVCILSHPPIFFLDNILNGEKYCME